MNNILVTGGAGYIGSHIVEQLIKTKARIIIIDNLATGYKKLINKKAIFVKGDIKNFRQLSKTISKYKINSLIHLAAYLNISEAERYKKGSKAEKYSEVLKNIFNNNYKYEEYNRAANIFWPGNKIGHGREDIKEKKREAIKIIVDAAKLIAPVIEDDSIDGFEWILMAFKYFPQISANPTRLELPPARTGDAYIDKHTIPSRLGAR